MDQEGVDQGGGGSGGGGSTGGGSGGGGYRSQLRPCRTRIRKNVRHLNTPTIS